MKKAAFLFTTLIVSTQAYDTYSQEVENPKAKYYIELSTGLREDNLKWNIAGPAVIGGVTYNPNILSELEWKNLKTWYNKIDLKGDQGRFALKLSFGYGQTFEGDVQDSDYLYSGRGGEFSRSKSDPKNSEMFDYLAALGYKYNITESSLFIFFVGYEWNQQKLKMKNGVQEIPASGSFNGLDSKYETLWQGALIGGDLDLALTPSQRLLLSYSYHFLDYEGKGYWNLRTDFQQDPSFKHEADGGGHKVNLEYTYFLNRHLGLNLKGEYRYYKVENGKDHTYFSNGSTSTTKFNESVWESYGVNAGITYRF